MSNSLVVYILLCTLVSINVKSILHNNFLKKNGVARYSFEEKASPTFLLDAYTEYLRPLMNNLTSTDQLPWKDIPLYRREYATNIFDAVGYNELLESVLSITGQHRFTQALSRLRIQLPHCDSEAIEGSKEATPAAPFPGGPMRRTYGFDLTKWITDQMLTVANNAGAANPIVGMMGMMAATSLVGVISTVLASVIDIVPPMIPPPIWILRPFPCLPMLTGLNCLLSVLYPITVADFTIAHVTDQAMNGVINSFPAKFNSKVGKTSVGVYNLCATVYFGMYCASLFPMCWLPIGLMEAQAFPVCFPQCLLVLVACPGFWLDDIMGPCNSVSVPPLCSFSVFINKNLIPPQYTNYEEEHPYPKDCPQFDPNYDLPLDLYKRVPPLRSPIEEAARSKMLRTTPAGPSIFHNLDDYKVVSPVHRICDCHPKLCTATSDTSKPCSLSASVNNEACRQYCRSMTPYTTTTTTVATPPEMEKVIIHLADVSGHHDTDTVI